MCAHACVCVCACSARLCLFIAPLQLRAELPNVPPHKVYFCMYMHVYFSNPWKHFYLFYLFNFCSILWFHTILFFCMSGILYAIFANNYSSLFLCCILIFFISVVYTVLELFVIKYKNSPLHNTEDIWRMLVTKELTVAIDFHSMYCMHVSEAYPPRRQGSQWLLKILDEEKMQIQVNRNITNLISHSFFYRNIVQQWHQQVQLKRESVSCLPRAH